MPIKRSAYKELRKGGRRHLRNVSAKSELKGIIKNIERLISAKKTDEAKKTLSVAVSKIDRASSKGIIRFNTASRNISRLMKKLAALGK